MATGPRHYNAKPSKFHCALAFLCVKPRFDEAQDDTPDTRQISIPCTGAQLQAGHSGNAQRSGSPPMQQAQVSASANITAVTRGPCTHSPNDPGCSQECNGVPCKAGSPLDTDEKSRGKDVPGVWRSAAHTCSQQNSSCGTCPGCRSAHEACSSSGGSGAISPARTIRAGTPTHDTRREDVHNAPCVLPEDTRPAPVVPPLRAGGVQSGSEHLNSALHDVNACGVPTSPFRHRFSYEQSGSVPGRRGLRPSGLEAIGSGPLPPAGSISNFNLAGLRAPSRLSGAFSLKDPPNNHASALTNAGSGSGYGSTCSGSNGADGTTGVWSPPAGGGGRRRRHARGSASCLNLAARGSGSANAGGGGGTAAGEDDSSSTATAPSSTNGMAADRNAHRASTSSALCLMTPRDLLATATGRAMAQEALSTLGMDELSTVGSGASAAYLYQLPLLATRPSVMEEGGMAFADLMKGAAWRGGGGGGATMIELAAQTSSPPLPFGQGAALATGSSSRPGLSTDASGEFLQHAPTFGVYAGGNRSGAAAVAPQPGSGLLSDSSKSSETHNTESPYGPAGRLQQQHSASGQVGTLAAYGSGPLDIAAALDSPTTLPGLSAGPAPGSAAAALGPFARLKGSSWSRLRCSVKRAPTYSHLSHVPEEDIRSISATAKESPLAPGVPPIAACNSSPPPPPSFDVALRPALDDAATPRAKGTPGTCSNTAVVHAASGDQLQPATPGAISACHTEDADLFCGAPECGGGAATGRPGDRGCDAATADAERKKSRAGADDLVLDLQSIAKDLRRSMDGDRSRPDSPAPLLLPRTSALFRADSVSPRGEAHGEGMQGENMAAQAAVQPEVEQEDAAEVTLQLESARRRLPRLQIPRRSDASLSLVLLQDDSTAAGQGAAQHCHGGGDDAGSGGLRAELVAQAAEAAAAVASFLPAQDVSMATPGPEVPHWPSTASQRPPPLSRNTSISSAAITPPASARATGLGTVPGAGGTGPSTGRYNPAGFAAPTEAARAMRGSIGGASSPAAVVDAGWFGGTPRAVTTAPAFDHAGSPPGACSRWPSRLLNENSVGVDYDSAAFASGLTSPAQRPNPCISRQPSHALQVACPSEVVLQKAIGKGCAGQVFRGTWRGQRVAIKVITHSQAEAGSGAWRQEEEQVRKIEQEAALGICLDHPNIVATYAAFTKVTGPQTSALSRQGSGAGHVAHTANLQAALDRVVQLRNSPYSSAPLQPQFARSQLPSEAQTPLSRAGNAAAAAAGARGGSGSGASHTAHVPAVGSFSPLAGGGGGIGAGLLSRTASRSRLSNAPTEEAPVSLPLLQDARFLRGTSLGSAWGYGAPGAISSNATRGVSHASMSLVAPSSGYFSAAMPASPAARGGGGGGLFSDACPSPAAAAAAGITTWQTFIVMELCPCGSLRAALDAKMLHDLRGAPRLHEVLPLAWEVACALQYLHANGVVHGDLKAANVMLANATPPHPEAEELGPDSAPASSVVPPPSGPAVGSPAPTPRAGAAKPRPTYTAKVADFSHSYQVELNLRRLRETNGADGGGGAADGAGDMASPSHAAPELFEENALPNLQSDIYSLGVVLWELYGGRKPYDKCRSPGEVLAAKRKMTTERVLSMPDTWLPEYASLCRSCWRSASERPSLESLVSALAALCRAHLPHVELCAPTTITADQELPPALIEPLPEQDSVDVAAGAPPAAPRDGAASTVVVDPCAFAAAAVASERTSAPAAAAVPAAASGSPHRALLPTFPFEPLGAPAAERGSSMRPNACFDAEVLQSYVYGPPPPQQGSNLQPVAAAVAASVPLPPMPSIPPVLMQQPLTAGGKRLGAVAGSDGLAPVPQAGNNDAAGSQALPPQPSSQGLSPRSQHGMASASASRDASDSSAKILEPRVPAIASQAPRHASSTTVGSSSCTSIVSPSPSVYNNATGSGTGVASASGKVSTGNLCDEDFNAALAVGSRQPMPPQQAALPFPWPSQSPSAAAAAPAALQGVSAVSLANGAAGAEVQPCSSGDIAADESRLRAAYAASRTRGSLGSGGDGAWGWEGPSPFSSTAAVGLMSARSAVEPVAEPQREMQVPKTASGDALTHAGTLHPRHMAPMSPSSGAGAGSVQSPPPSVAASSAAASAALPIAVSGGSARPLTRRTGSAHHDIQSSRLEPLPEMESCHLHLRPDQLGPPPMEPLSNSGGRPSLIDRMPFLDPCPMDGPTSLLVEMLPPLDMPSRCIPLPAPPPAPVATLLAPATPSSGDLAAAAAAVGYVSTTSTPNAYMGDTGGYTRGSAFLDTPQATQGGGTFRRASTLSDVPPSPSSSMAAAAAAGGFTGYHLPTDVSPPAFVSASSDAPISASRNLGSADRLYRLMYYSGKFARFASGQVTAAPPGVESAGGAAHGYGGRGQPLRQCSSSLGCLGPEAGGGSARDVHFYSTYTPPAPPPGLMPFYASYVPPPGSAIPAQRASMGGARQQPPLRSTSYGHKIQEHEHGVAGSGAAAAAPTAVPRSFHHSVSGVNGDALAASQHDSGSLFGSCSSYTHVGPVAAAAAAAMSGASPLQRQSYGLNSVASVASLRQRMRQQSRMFTTEELEAVLTSIPRFGDPIAAAYQGQAGYGTPTGLADSNGFFSRSGDGA